MNQNQQNVSPAESRPSGPLVKMEGFLHLPFNSRLNNQTRSSPEQRSRKVAFLDRDGVLVEDVNFLTDPRQLNLLPGVIEALRMLMEDHFIVVVTNQSAIARGWMSEEDLLRINGALVTMLDSEKVLFDALYYCPHHPHISDSIYGIKCLCRKPKPGMLRQAVQDWDLRLFGSFMVGDRYSDVEAARAVGIQSVLVGEVDRENPETCVSVHNLLEATYLMLDPKRDASIG